MNRKSGLLAKKATKSCSTSGNLDDLRETILSRMSIEFNSKILKATEASSSPPPRKGPKNSKDGESKPKRKIEEIAGVAEENMEEQEAFLEDSKEEEELDVDDPDSVANSPLPEEAVQESLPLDSSLESKPNSGFTKTGKRKKKYFRGFKYSLNPKKKIKKKSNRETGTPTFGTPEAPGTPSSNADVLEESMEFRMDDSNSNFEMDSPAPGIEVNSPAVDPSPSEFGQFMSDSEGGEDQEDMISMSSHPMDETKESGILENEEHLEEDEPVEEENESKLEGDEALEESGFTQEGSDEEFEGSVETEESVAEAVKRRRQSVSRAPDELELGDVPEENTLPTSPEPSVTEQSLKVARCCCQSKKRVIASVEQDSTEEYCMAVDSIDEQTIGCRNRISNSILMTPGVRIPFLLLCRVHQERLKQHHCCPSCGVFCTQGKFVRCKDEEGMQHLYHRSCQVSLGGDSYCPHCGLPSTPYDVRLELRVPQAPTFFLQQEPVKPKPMAKMGFPVLKEEKEKLDGKLTRVGKTWTTYTVPETGKVLTAEGLQSVPSQEELEKLLNVLANGEYLDLELGEVDLHTFVMNSDLEKLLKALANGADANTQYPEHDSQTAMHAAVLTGSLSAAHVLVRAGASPDMRDTSLMSPLMLASSRNQKHLIKYLVEIGASSFLRGEDGLTALHWAAKAGHLEACFALLSFCHEKPNYIDIQDDGGWTALVWGAEHKHSHIVRFLLDRGADPLVQDFEQNSALHWAAFSGKREIAEMFLKHGCKLNMQNVHGDTPLHIAARRDSADCAMLFLDYGADLTITNQRDERPMDSASVIPNSKTWTLLSVNMLMSQSIGKSICQRKKVLSCDISNGKERIPIQCLNAVDEEDVPMNYIYVKDNCETSHININRSISSLQVHCNCTDNCYTLNCMCGHFSVQCWYDKEGRLIPSFNYADPPMMFECNRTCRCHVGRCKNRVFQTGVIIQFELFRTNTKGWGVRTMEEIPKGTYVCEYVGEIISDTEADQREDDSYLFDLDNRDGETFCLDARRYGNIARFINHHCAANLTPVKMFVDHQDTRFPRIAFFASRDIKKHEELGFDYGEKFWIIKSKMFTCSCGAENCKYSETTIQETLERYRQKLKEQEEKMKSRQLATTSRISFIYPYLLS